jgi:hypothetical protein
MLSTLSRHLQICPSYPESISSSNSRNLGPFGLGINKLHQNSPSIIELQKFCQTWWLLKVQLLLALIVMTWALVLLALQ